MRNISQLHPMPTSLDISDHVVIVGQAYNQSSIINSSSSATKAKLSFSGYGKEANKKLIRGLADGCCGYCGIRINDTNTETVEHFRPKAELRFKSSYLTIDGIKQSKSLRNGKHIVHSAICNYGYFLWGDDGLNLLPACECCNTGQGLNGIYVVEPRPLDGLSDKVLDPGNIEYSLPYGKKNFFPIWLKSKGVLNDARVGSEFVNEITEEYPLLFNPYTDDPNNLFTYKEPIPASDDGSFIMKIRPKQGLSKKERLKAQISINLLGLNRALLCTKRADVFLNLDAIEQQFEEYISDNNLSISEWSFLASRLASYFDKRSSGLLGFTQLFFGSLIEKIHQELLTRFTSQASSILNPTSSFDTKVKELFIFYRRNFSRSPSRNRFQNKIRDI